jgi:hypothetical protein
MTGSFRLKADAASGPNRNPRDAGGFRLQPDGRPRSRCTYAAFLVVCLAWIGPALAQQLLERVVATVNGVPILLTDVNAAIGLGLVEIPGSGDPAAAARAQLIDRQLMLAEVARFAPPEPDAASVEREVAAFKARAGDRLPELTRSTGLDEQRLRELARETLRLRAYLAQRFGPGAAVTNEDVAQWVRDLRARAEITAPLSR